MSNSLLYIAHRIPYPPNKGDKIRSFNQIKSLSQRFTIDLVCLADNPDDLKYKPALKKFCRNIAVFPLNTRAGKLKGLASLFLGRSISEGYFFHPGMAKKIHHWMQQYTYNAVLCFSSPMARYLEPFGKKRANQPKLVMDFCDLDSDKWRQYSQHTLFPMNLIYRLESRRLLSFEKKVNQAFDASVFVSETEAGLFKAYFPGASRVFVIANGVDLSYFNPDVIAGKKHQTPPTLMFAGVMDYHANVDGILWFCRKVLPQIRARVPDVRLYIVGSRPAVEVQKLDNGHSIIVTGFVKDIRPWYARADICIVPLRIARGIQNKVLEAMAMGKPVVSTSQALQGLATTTFLFRADSPGAFSGAVTNLIQTPGKAEVFGRQARKEVEKAYAWPIHMGHMAELLTKG